jgi:hypothetical protein
MTTPARIAAKRRNPRKSTCPTTVEGKAASAQDALRHGLTARPVVCRDEREEDFAEFRAALWDALAPADAVEEQMVERIVLISWRLRRTARAERGIINDGPDGEARPLCRLDRARLRLFGRGDDTARTLRGYSRPRLCDVGAAASSAARRAGSDAADGAGGRRRMRAR